jgi:hypothetical protein
MDTPDTDGSTITRPTRRDEIQPSNLKCFFVLGMTPGVLECGATILDDLNSRLSARSEREMVMTTSLELNIGMPSDEK